MDATTVALPLYPVHDGREESYFSTAPSANTTESLAVAGHLSLVLVMPGHASKFKVFEARYSFILLIACYVREKKNCLNLGWWLRIGGFRKQIGLASGWLGQSAAKYSSAKFIRSVPAIVQS